MKLWLPLLSIGLVSACGKAQETPGGEASVTINGSGSTFQKAFQEVAIEGFTTLHPTITVNYGGGGSGKGRQDLADMVTDYACSDAPFKQADKARIKGGELVYVPILLGAITVSYNLPGVDKLQLSADTIAKIFQREITTWNDPAIAADNPGVELPAIDIVVAHRSDGSGTTEQFTLYLTKAAPDAWKLGSASSVPWPADTQAGNGNSGVAQIIRTTPGAIGYVDLPDAKASGLVYARVKNKAGTYVDPSVASAQAAGDGIRIAEDATFVAVNAGGPAVYPITAPTWCMAYVTPGDASKAAAIKAYFQYMITDGQKLLPEIDFAPLSTALKETAIAQVAKLQG
jgi:phosphate transport system substrate-binding protein